MTASDKQHCSYFISLPQKRVEQPPAAADLVKVIQFSSCPDTLKYDILSQHWFSLTQGSTFGNVTSLAEYRHQIVLCWLGSKHIFYGTTCKSLASGRDPYFNLGGAGSNSSGVQNPINLLFSCKQHLKYEDFWNLLGCRRPFRPVDL